ncbi:hypothetical protein DM02DRAFT_616060 [Periconia macrospinosa]|uniref:Threonyl/alanyl tRNA synthetase SAD domain-containing protein n=1 Tax=Periconia macrospinosa TaxID=97972 RepID=A0A2V1DIX9_9PLEO|nr:hypothetical protein DM02DRAFT_616060 [Periconia macrospinosa]
MSTTPAAAAPSSLPLTLSKTEALYQKDGTLTTHTTTLTSLLPLASYPAKTQALFKPIPPTTTSEDPNAESQEKEREGLILTALSTIFHAQGGGQPSDTGVITTTTVQGTKDKNDAVAESELIVHQVRKLPSTSTILHLVSPSSSPSSSAPLTTTPIPTTITQTIDAQKRLLHSRLHTAGHVLGLAIHLLSRPQSPSSSADPPVLPIDLKDGKASHYPSAAFVECFGTNGGVITGDKKSVIQAKVDELVKSDLEVRIAWLGREDAETECIGGIEAVNLGGGEGGGGEDEEEEGVRVVHIGGLGCYACGGTHVKRLAELGRVVVRSIKRQKGVSKVGYDVV